MGIKYIREGEEPAYKCDYCDTTWKQSWLYEYSSEIICPMCNELWVETGKYGLHKAEGKRINYLYRKKINLEKELDELNYKLLKHESTPIIHAIGTLRPGHYENLENLDKMDVMRPRHIRDLQAISYIQTRIKYILMNLAFIDWQIKKTTKIIPEPIPRTVHQSCVSHSFSAKPQYDWKMIEEIFPKNKWKKC